MCLFLLWREVWKELTAVAVVINQDDLFKQVCRCVVDNTVDRAQDHWERLIYKDEDHGELREVLWVRQLFTPVKINSNLLSIKTIQTFQIVYILCIY